MHFKHWGRVLPLSFLPFNTARGRGTAVGSPSGSGQRPATKHILTRFEVKLNHMELMSCIASAASYRIATDLFYDDTNHTINYVNENSVLYARLIQEKYKKL